MRRIVERGIQHDRGRGRSSGQSLRGIVRGFHSQRFDARMEKFRAQVGTQHPVGRNHEDSRHPRNHSIASPFVAAPDALPDGREAQPGLGVLYREARRLFAARQMGAFFARMRGFWVAPRSPPEEARGASR